MSVVSFWLGSMIQETSEHVSASFALSHPSGIFSESLWGFYQFWSYSDLSAESADTQLCVQNHIPN